MNPIKNKLPKIAQGIGIGIALLFLLAEIRKRFFVVTKEAPLFGEGGTANDEAAAEASEAGEAPGAADKEEEKVALELTTKKVTPQG